MPPERSRTLAGSGSLCAMAVLLGAGAVASCREAASPEVPPVTAALAPPPQRGPEPASAPIAGAGSLAAPTREAPVTASFVDVPGTVDAPRCSRLMIAVAKGKVSALGETLAVGDVLVLTYPEPLTLEGAGLVVVARRDFSSDGCHFRERAAVDKRVVRALSAPALRWANGGMSAHLDVGEKLSPDVYLGRLEGTAAVAEHIHAGSWEILAAVEASGSLTIDGTLAHIGPRQITIVPPGAKHAWKPDPGTRLVAIQMYSPPGPEQRFVALAAAELAAGGDAH